MRILILSLAVLVLCPPTPAAGAQGVADSFRLPLDDYPLNDNCLGWGDLNPGFSRCGLPGKHVADDACRPNGTDIFAVADGRVMFWDKVGVCQNNWGWLMVAEHVLPDGSRVSSIYGHCQPVPGLLPGQEVVKGERIATINYLCTVAHIHFGIHLGPYGAAVASYPDWLLGYLPDTDTCVEYPVLWPGDYVDPVQFVLDRAVPAVGARWGRLKARYR